MADIDSIIQTYLQGKSSEEENQQLYRWIQESPENKRRFFADKDIWDSLELLSNQKGYNPETELELVTKRVGSIPSKPVYRLNRIIQIAALVLITFGLGWASQFLSLDGAANDKVITMKEIIVPKGQINQVFLADGTRIWVNSETQLTVPDIFTDEERVVSLNGEAYFEVAKDSKRPFRVKLNGQQIEVLGTSFNVKAYKNSNEIETTLETGSIQLKTGNQVTMLTPGEQCVYDRCLNKLILSKVDPYSFSAWKDGRFEFQNEELLEVFKIVERWYDVEIVADEKYFKDMHFSGVIKRNKDARHFIEMLNLSVPLTYEIKADKIYLKPR